MIWLVIGFIVAIFLFIKKYRDSYFGQEVFESFLVLFGVFGFSFIFSLVVGYAYLNISDKPPEKVFNWKIKKREIIPLEPNDYRKDNKSSSFFPELSHAKPFILSGKIIYLLEPSVLGNLIHYVYRENNLMKTGKARNKNVFIKESNEVKSPQLIIKKPRMKICFWFIVHPPANYKIFVIPQH